MPAPPPYPLWLSEHSAPRPGLSAMSGPAPGLFRRSALLFRTAPARTSRRPSVGVERRADLSGLGGPVADGLSWAGGEAGRARAAGLAGLAGQGRSTCARGRLRPRPPSSALRALRLAAIALGPQVGLAGQGGTSWPSEVPPALGRVCSATTTEMRRGTTQHLDSPVSRRSTSFRLGAEALAKLPFQKWQARNSRLSAGVQNETRWGNKMRQG